MSVEKYPVFTLDQVKTLTDQGYNIDIRSKLCDFCNKELPIEHESKTCPLPICSTIYDVCETCHIQGKGLLLCFKHGPTKTQPANDFHAIEEKQSEICVIFTTYEQRWSMMSDESYDDDYNNDNYNDKKIQLNWDTIQKMFLANSIYLPSNTQQLVEHGKLKIILEPGKYINTMRIINTSLTYDGKQLTNEDSLLMMFNPCYIIREILEYYMGPPIDIYTIYTIAWYVWPHIYWDKKKTLF